MRPNVSVISDLVLLVRFTVMPRPHAVQLVDRYFERKKAGVPIDSVTVLSSIATSK